MDDLISRQAAIEAIEKHIGMFDAIDTNYLDGLRTAMSLLHELPSAQPEQKWIPYWQEYPDDNRFVLVCNDDGRMAIAQYIGHEVDKYHPWQIAYCPYDVDVWEEDEHGKIVAWMDLPKPYREGGNDKERSLSTFERLQSRILHREYGQDTATQLRFDKGDN